MPSPGDLFPVKKGKKTRVAPSVVAGLPTAPGVPGQAGVSALPTKPGVPAGANALNLTPQQRKFLESSQHPGFFERFADAMGRNIVATGEEAPTGIKDVYNAAVAANPIDPTHLGHVNLHPAEKLGKALLVQTAHDVRHPLRNPGFTALDIASILSLGAGSGLRLAAAGRAAGEDGAEEAAEAGARAGTLAKTRAVAKALRKNPALTQRRTLTIPGEGGKAMQVQGVYSRSGLGMAAQKLSDAALQRGAESEGRLGEVAENALHNRAAKFETRNEKAAQVQLRAAGKRVMQVGRKAKLTPAENRALRIVAETVPYNRVLGATEGRLADAERTYRETEDKLDNADLTPSATRKAKKDLRRAEDEIKNHTKRLEWTQDAADFLTEDENGRPMIHPDHPELQSVYDSMVDAADSREALLKGAGLMDDETAQNAIAKQARMAGGAKYVKPTPGRLGDIAGHTDKVKRVARLEARFERRIAQTPETGFGAVTRPRTREEAVARLDDLEREHYKIVDEMAQRQFGPIDKSEVARRNSENAKARRQAAGVTRTGRRSGASGVKAVLRPTVKQERRNLIERAVGDAIEKNPDHPSFQRWKSRSEEIDQLQRAITPDPEELFGNGNGAPRDYGTVSEFRADHPSVLRLGAALSVARDELERSSARREALMTPTGLVGAENVTPGEGAIHVGSPAAPPRFGITGRVSSSRTVGHTRPRGSLKEATGLARQRGLERNDVTELLAERQHEAVGLSSLKRLVDRVRPAGTKVPQREDDVFMWTDGDVVSSARVDPDVRDFLQGRYDPEAHSLDEEVMHDVGAAAALKNAIFEGPSKAKSAVGKFAKPSWELDPVQRDHLEAAAEEGKGVFVPRRLLGDRVVQQPWKLNPKLQSVLDKTNNVGRLGLIYLKANYPLVQGLSNVALNLIQQGVFAPENLARSARLGKTLGPDLTAMVDDAVEQGFAGAVLKGEGKGPLAAVTGKVAHVAGLVADKLPRRAAFLHEAMRQGYSTPAEMRDLLTNPEKLGDLAQVTQRAKEAIIDFGDLGPTERDFIRHFVFVYPWVKGSTVYAGRFLRDHPIQAALLGNLGQRGAAENEQAFGARPTYDMNFVPVGGNRAIDLQSLNPFSSPIELGRSAVGFLRSPSAMASEPLASYFSPAISTPLQLATGRDERGFVLKGDLAQRLRQLEVTQTPLSQLLTQAVPSSRSVLGTPIQGKTFPNANAYLRFLLGGLSPRVYDRGALNTAASYQTSQR